MESITTSCHEIHDHIVTKASQIENATVTTTSISDNNMKLHSTKSHSPIGIMSEHDNMVTLRYSLPFLSVIDYFGGLF